MIDEYETMRTGIYKIIDIYSGRFYLGSSSKDVYERFYNHRWKLINNRHENKRLQFVWKQLGESSFIFQFYEPIKPKNCLVVEQYYLDLYWNTGRLYNILPIAGGIDRSLFTLSDEALKAQGERIAKYNQSIEGRNKKSLKMLELHQDPEFTKNALKGLLKLAYSGEDHPNAKTYKIREPNGDIVYITNMALYCREKGLTKAALHRTLKETNRTKTHKNYKVLASF